jgi:hypothetical protein
VGRPGVVTGGKQSKNVVPWPLSCWVSHAPLGQHWAPAVQQAPPHTRFAAAQQTPPVQAWPAAQALLHRPQLAVSLEVSTQALPQAIRPLWHVHCPAEQLTLVAQAVVQPPQCWGSMRVSTQTPPHAVLPVGQQIEAVQCWPLPQAWPHAPQFEASLVRSTHHGKGAPAQCTAAPVQVQALPLQVPRPQDCPHAPQFAELALVSTQAGEPPQSWTGA